PQCAKQPHPVCQPTPASVPRYYPSVPLELAHWGRQAPENVWSRLTPLHKPTPYLPLSRSRRFPPLLAGDWVHCEQGRHVGCPAGRVLYFVETASMGTVRQEAIRAIAGAKHQLNRVDFKKTHIKDLFGINVFNEAVQRQRLPKPVFKALQKTIKHGAPLDPA